MGRRQTIVQLNDELLGLLDERAARTGQSRSHVIREAVEYFLEADRAAEIDRQIVEAYTRMPPPEDDPWAEAAAEESIRAESW